MSLKAEHKGHEIEYVEWEDNWRCASLSLTCKSLALMRKAIDRKVSILRKAAHVEAALLPSTFDRRVRKVKIVEYAGQTFNRFGNKRPIEEVFITEDGAKGRSKANLDGLFLLTAANMDAVAEIEALKKQMDALEQKAKELIAGISTVTLDDIAPLVAAHKEVNGG